MLYFISLGSPVIIKTIIMALNSHRIVSLGCHIFPDEREAVKDLVVDQWSLCMFRWVFNFGSSIVVVRHEGCFHPLLGSQMKLQNGCNISLGSEKRRVETALHL